MTSCCYDRILGSLLSIGSTTTGFFSIYKDVTTFIVHAQTLEKVTYKKLKISNQVATGKF